MEAAAPAGDGAVPADALPADEDTVLAAAMATGENLGQ